MNSLDLFKGQPVPGSIINPVVNGLVCPAIRFAVSMVTLELMYFGYAVARKL
jgi:hypothetical protein